MPLPESPSTDCEVVSRPHDVKEASSASPGKRRLLLAASRNSSLSSSGLGLPKLSTEDGYKSGESDTMLLSDSRPAWACSSTGGSASGYARGMPQPRSSTGGSASGWARGTPQPRSGASSAAAVGSGRFASGTVSGSPAAIRGTPQPRAEASSSAAPGPGTIAGAGVSVTTDATSDGTGGTIQPHADDNDGAVAHATGACASGEVNLAAADGSGFRQDGDCSELDKQRLMSLVTDTGLQIRDEEAIYICHTVNSRTSYKVTEHPAMNELVVALHTLSESPAEELLQHAYDNGDYVVLEYLACSEAGARDLLLQGCVANVKDLCRKLKDVARPERERVGLMDLARLCRSLTEFINNKDVWHLCEILSEFSMSQLQPPRRLMDTAVRLIRDRLADEALKDQVVAEGVPWDHLRTLLSDDADGLGLLEFVKTLSSEKTEYMAAAIYCMRNMRDICLEGPPGTMKTSIGRFLDKIGPLLHVTVKVMSGEKAAGTNRCPHAVTLGKDMSFGIFDRSSSEYVHAISSNAKKLAAYVPKGREPVVRMWTEGAKSRGEHFDTLVETRAGLQRMGIQAAFSINVELDQHQIRAIVKKDDENAAAAAGRPVRRYFMQVLSNGASYT